VRATLTPVREIARVVTDEAPRRTADLEQDRRNDHHTQERVQSVCALATGTVRPTKKSRTSKSIATMAVRRSLPSTPPLARIARHRPRGCAHVVLTSHLGARRDVTASSAVPVPHIRVVLVRLILDRLKPV